MQQDTKEPLYEFAGNYVLTSGNNLQDWQDDFKALKEMDTKGWGKMAMAKFREDLREFKKEKPTNQSN